MSEDISSKVKKIVADHLGIDEITFHKNSALKHDSQKLLTYINEERD